MRRRIAPVLLAVLLAAALGWAQAPPPQPERRTFAVSVLDKDANAVRGLTAANFRGTFRGQLVRILSATEDSSPRRIILLLDTGKGMSDANASGLMWAAAEDFVDNSGGPHNIAVCTIGGGVRCISRASKDRRVVRDTLAEIKSKVKPAGWTMIDTGIGVAADELSPPLFGDALFIISNTQSYATNFSILDTVEALSRSGIRVFFLSIDNREVPRDLPRKATPLTPAYTEPSGGLGVDWELGLDKSPTFLSRVRQLYEPMTHAYKVEVELPVLVEKPSEWRFEVVGPDGKKLKTVELAYPRLLVPAEKKK